MITTGRPTTPRSPTPSTSRAATPCRPSDIADGTSNGIAYTVTDADPTDGSLAWFIDGPIPAGDSVTIAYTVSVWDATEADESIAGPEISNEAENPSYWAVPTHTSGDGHREYFGNTDKQRSELDLASIGDYVWFDANGDGVQDPTNHRLRVPRSP